MRLPANAGLTLSTYQAVMPARLLCPGIRLVQTRSMGHCVRVHDDRCAPSSTWQALSRQGCHRTALECCKLLLALEPEDPMGALMMVDYLALRAGRRRLGSCGSGWERRGEEGLQGEGLLGKG